MQIGAYSVGLFHRFTSPIFTFSLKYQTPFSRYKKPYLSFSTAPFSKRVF